MSSSYPGSPSARDPGHPPVLRKRRFWEPACHWDTCVDGNRVTVRGGNRYWGFFRIGFQRNEFFLSRVPKCEGPGAPACLGEKEFLGTCLSLGYGCGWKSCHRSWREPLPEFLSNRTSEK
jgi:hypothetical protein